MLNQKICLAGGANTGFGDCYFNPANIVGMILTPRGATITEADTQDFAAFLNTKFIDADPSQRWYPVSGFVGITDNTEDPTIESFGYGGKAVVREGDYDWTLRFTKGGICLLKALRKFNGTDKEAFFVDGDGNLLGTTVAGTMQSVALTLLYTMPWKVNDGSTSTNYGIRTSFRPKPVNEDLAFLDMAEMGIVFSSFQGLQNVSLVVLDPEEAPITNVRLLSGCNRSNLYEDAETVLVDEGLWTATTVSGAAVVVSTVVANATLEAFTVTVASAAESYYLNLVDPEALESAGFSGYEAIRVKVTV